MVKYFPCMAKPWVRFLGLQKLKTKQKAPILLKLFQKTGEDEILISSSYEDTTMRFFSTGSCLIKFLTFWDTCWFTCTCQKKNTQWSCLSFPWSSPMGTSCKIIVQCHNYYTECFSLHIPHVVILQLYPFPFYP